MKRRTELKENLPDIAERAKQLEEKDVENLKRLDEVLNNFYEKISSSDNESLKTIYGRILDEQTGTARNKLLIDQLKSQLLRAYIEAGSEFKQFSESLEPGNLTKIFEQEGKNLKSFYEESLLQITALMSQELTFEVTVNRFRYSIFLEKINDLKHLTSKILKTI